MLVSGHLWPALEKAKWQAVGTQSIFKAYMHEYGMCIWSWPANNVVAPVTVPVTA